MIDNPTRNSSRDFIRVNNTVGRLKVRISYRLAIAAEHVMVLFLNVTAVRLRPK